MRKIQPSIVSQFKVIVRACQRGMLVFGFVFAQIAFGGTSPSLMFYVPFPEADALTALKAVETGGSGDVPIDPINSYISIAAIADGTIIFYDQWEDGYETDHDYASPRQSTTQIWGDGNPANGVPPGVPDDLINAGTVIVLGNLVTSTTPLVIDYDARDKIASTRSISVTRTYWASATGTLFAGCVETFDTSKWGNEYRSPIGQDIPDATDGQMFEYAAFSIMARDNATTVRIDADNNGTFETTNTLNEGQTCFVNGGVNVGGRIVADKPIQVILFSGDIASNYESRDSSLLPVTLWSNNYYTPVSTSSGDGTRVWLYNPGTSSITVSNSYRIGTGSLVNGATTVAAGSYSAVLLQNGAAARFFTTGSPAPVFYAYSTTDSDSTTTTDNQAWDWSFTLIPQHLLSPQVLVGLGIGRDPTSATNPNENGNPVWITPVGNGSTPITAYIDYDGDNSGAFTDPNGNRYDASTNLIELQQAKIYDPDGDQTAMLVYVLSTNVTLAAAWGQDTTTATAGAPGLDVGTSIPPEDVIDASKSLTVVGDADSDGFLSPSDQAEYVIRIGNTARAPIPADVVIKDVLSADSTYLANSTAYRTSTNGTWTTVADNGSGTAFPLDDTGYRIYSTIPVNGAFEVRFRVTIDAYANLDAGRMSIVNTGSVFAVMFNRTITFRNETELHGSLGDRVWNDADNDGVQDAGESGVNGVIVYLDVNTNGVRDVGESYSTTSGDGNYLLTGTYLEAGTHRVRIDTTTLPPGTVPTYDVDGTVSDHGATVTLAGGQDRVDVDFGYRVPARLGDYVWVDSNRNGQQDLGELGLSNVVVRLYNNSGVLVATTNSSAAGAYSFTNLAAGTYTVGFTPPTGYLFTPSNVGSDSTDSDPLTGTNRTASVTMVNGQTELSVDAGFYQLASLSGAVRVDVDGDGVIDADDTAGIAGVMVRLLDDASNVVATANTSVTGDYSFTNLSPGSYTVAQVLPAGYTNTFDVVAPNDLRIPRVLASGQSSTGNDFYDARTGTVTAQRKVLYLSDPSQALDRIDPVATGDATTANTATLIPYRAAGLAVDAATSTLKALPLTALAYDASASVAANAASITLSHTTGTGPDRLLLVGVSMRAGGQSVNSVTYNGLSLTRVGAQSNGENTRMEMWLLLNPPSGTYAVVATLSASGRAVLGATTFSGVDQTEPLGTFASATGTSTPPSVTVASSLGELVFDTLAHATGQTAMTPGANQSERWDVDSGGTNAQDVRGVASTKAGASNVTTSWTAGGSDAWAMGAVSIKPARVSIAHTTGTGADRLMLVGVSYEDDDRDGAAGDLVISSVTYAGQALTLVGTVNGTADETAQIYRLLNPPSGTGSVVVAVDNPEAGDGIVVGVVTFTGADQTAPLGAFASAIGDTSPASFTVASGVGEIIFDTFMLDDGDAIAGSGSGQTPHWNLTQTANASGSGSTKAGAAPSTTMSWTFNTGTETWALGAVSVKPAIYGAPQTSFTQAPAFELPFDMALGTTVSITNFVNVTSGTMPANPAVTARLSAGGSTFLTLSSPTYNSGNGTLVWSGALGSAVAIAAGQAISLSVSNAQSGVEFQIRYDSASSPSKIILPTASIIAVPSVGVYDAAYPGGSPVTSSSITAQRYVRVTVTDPFGAYDITGAGLAIDGPGTSGDVSASLTGAHVVASNGWSKTYEYVWQTVALSGSYALTVTANEGSEGITASGTTTEILYAATLGDFVWNDANGNGQQDNGEPGISNVVVRLYDSNSVVVGVTTSSVSGAYAFTNLVAGTYSVSFAPPAGYLFTTSNVGDSAVDSNPLVGTNRTAAVTLASSQTDGTIDAGFYPEASISGFVRVDLNGNGMAESGDTDGIAGVTVQLLDAASNVVMTAATAADGSYSFTGLRPGSYTVRETDLGGWYSTTDISVPNDNLIPVTLSVGQNSAGNNFHDTQPAAFGDRVWKDLDGDGTQDAFEPGIAGVRVYVDSNGSGTYNAGEPAATTAEDGSYLISGLAAGSYTARVDTATLPADLIQTYDLDGVLDHAAAVALTSNQTRTDIDFGYRSTAVYEIRGQVRDDFMISGNLNDPANPVGGVLVSLYSDPNGDGNLGDGSFIASVRTAPDGRYVFTNILSGAYLAVETDPTYSFSTADKVGPNDNQIPVVIVNVDSVENDFLDAVDPSGYLYDVADGRIVPGGSISVTGPGASILMDGNETGQYIFISTNNAPGTYTIAVTPPPGYVIDTTRPAQAGSFDPTGGPTPTVLGSSENTNSWGYLLNYSAASNTYYYTFSLEPGDPPVINNNFPLRRVVIEIAGTVFYDQNRLTDATVNGTGTNAAGLFANLVNPATHAVIAGVAVATDGTYRFAESDGVVTNTAYEVILTRTAQTVGASLTAATLPTAWVSTGEHVGADAGSDGTVDSRLLVSTTADGVREVNFGLDRVPDITPVITAVPNVMHAVQHFYITVRTTELNLVDTEGLITIRIPKDIRWVFDGPYDPNLTVLGSTALNNNVWAYSEDSTHHIFTSTAVIPAGGFSYFGFRAVWDAGQTRGRYTITSQIDSWSGGEDRIDNNVDAERLDYFIN